MPAYRPSVKPSRLGKPRVVWDGPHAYRRAWDPSLNPSTVDLLEHLARDPLTEVLAIPCPRHAPADAPCWTIRRGDGGVSVAVCGARVLEMRMAQRVALRSRKRAS